MAGPLDRLRRALGRPSNDDTNEPEWPRATGPALTVEVLGRGHRRGEDLELVPLDGHEHLGALLSVRREGPSLRRPGDLAAATDEPLHRITELTVVQAGALEHRDSLGHRGSLLAPATRLASAGAGIVSEVGPDRHLRRDGGMLDVLTIRWAQMSAVTPTVRIGEAPPARRQGRSEVRVLLGRPDGTPTAAGLLALQVRVAAGATVDVELPPDGDLVLVVLAGDALVGEALVPVGEQGIARRVDDGTRLTVATRLEGDDTTDLLVLVTPEPDRDWVHERGLVADDAVDLAEVRKRSVDGAFGRLPRMDG